MKKVVTGMIFILLVGCGYMPKDIVVIEDELIEKSLYIKGIKGGENIYLPEDSSEIYISDCSGYIYLAENGNIKKSIKIGEFAIGLTMYKDTLYASGSQGDFDHWMDIGGGIYKVSKDLKRAEKITGDYVGINGIAVRDNSLYFTSGSMGMFAKDGVIYRLDLESEENLTQEFITGLNSPNGIFLDADRLIFTETFKGVRVADKKGVVKKLFGKSRFYEGFDDLVKDGRGNYWVADQPNGFVKMFNSDVGKVVYFRNEELGVASSCKIRVEDGIEYLYVTEIKKSKRSKNYDGRGVYKFRIDSLLNYLN